MEMKKRPGQEEERPEMTSPEVGEMVPAEVKGPTSPKGMSDEEVKRIQGQASEIVKQIEDATGSKEMEWGRQWLAGDTANEWEEELGEDFWNEWANEFGYTYPTLRNAMRVCAAIPLPCRKYLDLRYSHHVVVYNLNREDIEMWLDKCDQERWSVAEFRRQVKGERPRVKRYSPGEIHDLADEYPF